MCIIILINDKVKRLYKKAITNFVIAFLYQKD